MPTTSYRTYDFGLNDLSNRESIIFAGGQVMVSVAGSPDPVALYDPDDGFQPITQPVDANYGRFKFATLDSVLKVDVFGISATGVAFNQADIGPMEAAEYYVESGDLQQVAKIPVSAAAQVTDATEIATLLLPAFAVASPFAAVYVSADGAATIDFGILSTEGGGDANGFGAAVTMAAVGTVPVQSAATTTRGTLLGGAVVDTGYPVPADGRTVSYTINVVAPGSGGYLIIPYTRAQ